MSDREYPREVWTLMPSFKPVKVTVVKKYATWSRSDYGDVTEKGKCIPVANMFPSLEAAIASGRNQAKATQADIDKRQENLNKRIAALAKAEAIAAHAAHDQKGGE